MRTVILIVVALVAALAVYSYVTGLSVVLVRNETGADAGITLFTGAQPIGSSTIPNHGSDFYSFTPHQAGSIAVTCRQASRSAANTLRVGRVRTATPTVFRVTLATCNRIARFEEDAY
jgi:hypothetical protein